MARGKKSETITIGVFGLGEVEPKTLVPLLEDYVGKADVQFIIPATSDHFTASVGAVCDWLDEENLPYDVVTDASSAKARSLRGVIKNAENEHKGSDVGTSIVNLLKDADDGRLLMFWDGELGNEDGGAYDAVEYADEQDIPAFDICDGLAPIDLDASDDGQDDDPEPEPEKTTRRSRKATEDDNDPPAAKRRGKAQDDQQDEPEREPVDPTLPTFEEAGKLGVRALRTFARDLGLAPSRKIGAMDIPTVLDLLYPIDGAAPATDPEPEPETPIAKGRRARKEAAGQTELPLDEPSLEQQIASSAYAQVSALPTQLNAEASVILGQFITLLATAVAEVVLAALELESK